MRPDRPWRFWLFDQAWRLAARYAREHEFDYVVVRTGDPEKPYAVEDDRGQANTIAMVCSDPDVSLRWLRPKCERIVEPAPVFPSANDR